MMGRFLPDCSCFLYEVCGKGTLRGLKEEKGIGNKGARMWERRHSREGCHTVLRVHLRFRMRMSREASVHSCVFISSHVRARPGVGR